MANVEHRDMVSSKVHEPKHISDSTAADAGKVITPLSGGTSELRNLTPAEVGIQFVYGEAALNANTTSFAVTAASDTTLYTESDYIALNSTRVPGVTLGEANGVTFDSTLNGLQIPTNGVYRITFWMNVATNTVNSKIGVKAKQNGVFSDFTVKSDVKEAGRVQVIMGHIFTTIAATGPVTLWMASDKTANLTVQDMRFTTELMKAS